MHPTQLEIINPLTYPGWDKLILNTPGGSFFHSSNWAAVLHDTYGYTPRYFSAVNDSALSVLVPVMEVRSIFTGRRGVSLPFSDFCEMLISESVDFRDVMDDMVKYGKRNRWKSIELMDGRYFPESTMSCSSYYDHVLELGKHTDALFATFNNNTKRNIRKAQQREVLVTRDDSMDSVKAFYRLHCLTRKRHGVPPQPYTFFENIHKRVCMSGHGFIMLASYGGTVIAGAIYFTFGDQAIFKFGASDNIYNKLRANSLVMWKAIEWLSTNGIKRLSFGRTELCNEGLRRFKTGWGSVERFIHYYKYDLVRAAFVSKSSLLSEIQKKLISKLPPFVLRTAGSLMYRHIG